MRAGGDEEIFCGDAGLPAELREGLDVTGENEEEGGGHRPAEGREGSDFFGGELPAARSPEVKHARPTAQSEALAGFHPRLLDFLRRCGEAQDAGDDLDVGMGERGPTTDEDRFDIPLEVVADGDDHVGAAKRLALVAPPEGVLGAVFIEITVDLPFFDIDAMDIEHHPPAAVPGQRSGSCPSGGVALGVDNPNPKDTAGDPHHERRPPAVESIRKRHPDREHRHQQRDRPHRANPRDGRLPGRPPSQRAERLEAEEHRRRARPLLDRDHRPSRHRHPHRIPILGEHGGAEGDHQAAIGHGDGAERDWREALELKAPQTRRSKKRSLPPLRCPLSDSFGVPGSAAKHFSATLRGLQHETHHPHERAIQTPQCGAGGHPLVGGAGPSLAFSPARRAPPGRRRRSAGNPGRRGGR